MELGQQSAQLQARRAHRDAGERRRQVFVQVAVALRSPAQAPQVIRSAKQQVSKWRANQLCSADYINAWDDLLQNPLQAADVLESESLWAGQLRQNSPFVDTVRALNAA